jgi:hypothetical protein
MIPQWQDTETGFLSQTLRNVLRTSDNLRSNCMRERRKTKGKISGSGAMVRGKWPYYDVMNFLEYYLQRRTMEMFQKQQLHLKFNSLIQMNMKWVILDS